MGIICIGFVIVALTLINNAIENKKIEFLK
jgi:hypothetical protein